VAIRKSIGALILALLAACSGGGSSSNAPAPIASQPPPATTTTIDVSLPWVTATPASAGFDEVRLNRAFNDAAAMPRFRSLLVARHGKLVSQNYFAGADRTTRFDVRSVTKSVVSTLTGIAIADGRLSSLDTTVGSFIGTPYMLDAGDRAVTLRQMLTMTSGYQWNENSGDDYNQWILSGDHVQFLFDRSQNTGTQFLYNSALVNLLGVVLQQAVGQPLTQYAHDKLFQPLGITSAEWERLETDMANGGSGIKMTAEDLLRFGQFILQRGQSGTTRIVNESWIVDATTPKFTWRNDYGMQRSVTYGHLWWVADAPAVPAAFAWGYGGQFVYVAPSLDLVVVATTNWEGMSAETNPSTFAGQILSIIAGDILPAARN
jgi:CubicO group peptidase (beta-lactamase class C family)